jgi:hypothetical protein
MAYRPNSQENKIKGTEAEEAFYKKFREHIIRKSSKDEDQHEHWDFLLRCKEGKERKVDVKSHNPTSDLLRVELVSRKFEGSKKGWLYGDSFYIVYRMGRNSDKFLFVKTAKLLELSKNIKDEVCLYKNPEAYKKCYPKDSNGSIIAFIPIEDLGEKDYIEL